MARNLGHWASLSCGVTAFLTLNFAGQDAIGLTRFSLSGSVSQSLEFNSDPVYQVAINVQPFLSQEGTEIHSLVAPNGTVAPTITPDWHGIFSDDLSLEEARSAFSGTWTFTEMRDGEPLQYEFDLPELTTSLFPPAPAIASPSEGEVVRSGFLLDWEYPTGRISNGYSFRSANSGGVSLGQFELLDDSSALLPLSFNEGVEEADLTLRIGQSQSQPFDVTPVSTGADATFVFRFVRIKSFSLPLTVTAQVPEPSAAALLLALMAGLLPSRVRSD